MMERLKWQLTLFWRIPVNKAALLALWLLPFLSVAAMNLNLGSDVLYEGRIISQSEFEAEREAWQNSIAGKISERWVTDLERKLEKEKEELSITPEAGSQDQKIRMIEQAKYDGVFALKEKAAAASGALPKRMRKAFDRNDWKYGAQEPSRRWMLSLCVLAMTSFFIWTAVSSTLANQEENWDGMEMVECAREAKTRNRERLLFGLVLVMLTTLWQIFCLLVLGRLVFGSFPGNFMVLSPRSLQPYTWKELFDQGLLMMVFAQLTAFFSGYAFSVQIRKPLFSLLLAMTFQLLPALLMAYLPKQLLVIPELFPMNYLMFFSPGQLLMSPYVVFGNVLVLKTEWAAFGLALSVLLCLFCMIWRKKYA